MVSLLPKSALGNVVVGVVAAVAGPAVLRPMLVGLVRAGYDVKDFASSSWSTARAQASKIREEATSVRSTTAMEDEIRTLRAEVQALKAARKG
ncbi:MAG: hypothetical protein FJW21_13660 [Acidimicrobiia bacterium]|nr:hypothetical protein [Acidimicrobiia bacterium]